MEKNEIIKDLWKNQVCFFRFLLHVYVMFCKFLSALLDIISLLEGYIFHLKND